MLTRYDAGEFVPAYEALMQKLIFSKDKINPSFLKGGFYFLLVTDCYFLSTGVYLKSDLPKEG